MKKTLIALAVAASAVASGSALAADGSWGSGANDFNMGGNIIIDAHKMIWDVFSGVSVNIDSAVESGVTEINLPVAKDIPVLGMRSLKVFNGGLGLTPQIKYGKDGESPFESAFKANKTTMTLRIKNKDNGQEIGTLKTKIWMAAYHSYKNADGSGFRGPLLGSDKGTAFGGGLPTHTSQIDASTLLSDMKKLIPNVDAYFDPQGMLGLSPSYRTFDDSSVTYSAMYGSGILAGENTTITLDTPATKNINWTAQLPITVTYI